MKCVKFIRTCSRFSTSGLTASIHATAKIIPAIRGFPHSRALTLALGSRCSPGTLNAALVASLIAEVALEVFLDGPVAHVALEESVVLLSL